MFAAFTENRTEYLIICVAMKNFEHFKFIDMILE